MWGVSAGGVGCKQRTNLAVFPRAILNNMGDNPKPLSVEGGGCDSARLPKLTHFASEQSARVEVLIIYLALIDIPGMWTGRLSTLKVILPFE